MRSYSSWVLLVSKARWRLCLRVTVIFSRAVRLPWWGIAVVSSRGPGGVRVGLLPLIHSESECAKESSGQGEELHRPGCWCKAREHKSRTSRGRFQTTSESRTRRNGMKASQQRQMQPVEIQLRVNDA